MRLFLSVCESVFESKPKVRIVAYQDDLQAKTDAVKRLQGETEAELAALLPSVLDRAFRGEL